jgi:hypothetical protein
LATGGLGPRTRTLRSQPVPGLPTPLPFLPSFLRGLNYSSPTTMLILSLRRLCSRSTLFSTPTVVQSASYVVARKNRAVPGDIDPTRNETDVKDSTQAASNSSMEPITNILDNVAFSESPQSNTFSSESLAHSSYLPPTQSSI